MASLVCIGLTFLSLWVSVEAENHLLQFLLLLVSGVPCHSPVCLVGDSDSITLLRNQLWLHISSLSSSVCMALLLSSATPSPRFHGILSVCLLSVVYALGKMTMEAFPVCGNESVSLFVPCTRSLYVRATCTSAKQNTLPTQRMNFALRLSWAGSVPVKHGCILYGTQPTSSKSLSPLLIYHLKSALTGSPLDVYYRNSMWQYICYTRSPCFLWLMNNFCTRNLNLLPNLIIINSVTLP